MAYTIQFEKSAAKQLSKLEKRVQIKIAAKIDELAFEPRPFGYKNWLTKAERAASKSQDTESFTTFSTNF